jgi:undecaprenyl-diphosphatase
MKTSKTLVLVNAISLLVFIFLTIGIFYSSFLVGLDSSISTFMSSIENDFLTSFLIAVSFIFDIKSVFIISFILSVYLWIKYSKKEAIFFIGVVGLSEIIVYILKELISRARPLNSLVTETSFAFPSGHAATAVVFFGALIYLISIKNRSKNLKLITIIISSILILLICFARLYLNVHWFSDVLGGTAIGIFILTGCILLKGIFNRK